MLQVAGPRVMAFASHLRAVWGSGNKRLGTRQLSAEVGWSVPLI